MKDTYLKKKLTLEKTTIVTLNTGQMTAIEGGAKSCGSCHPGGNCDWADRDCSNITTCDYEI